MEIRDIVIFKGRNIYSHKTVMKLTVDLGEYADIPTKDIPGFNQKLLKAFPGLKTDSCGLGYEGGFLEKLSTGTYLAHVLEHVILDIQSSLGYDVAYGKTRVVKEPNIYYLVYEYENEVAGLEAGKVASFILNCFILGEDVEIERFLDYLKKVSVDAELGPSTAAIVAEARKRNIPVTRIGNESIIQLNYGKHMRLLESTMTDATSCIAADITSNKQLTKTILSDYKIPVPCGKVVYTEISAVMAARQIGLPVVIKPFDSNQGKGVHLNLNTEEAIKEAFRVASKYSNGIIVEQYIKGKDYRILVVGDKVSAVSERIPALVVGDGTNNIKQLVDIINKDPGRGEHHEKPLTKIKLDNVAMNILEKRGQGLEYIPQKGEVVYLRENGNLSTGGTAIDRTDDIHPDNAEYAVRAANALGIDIAGVDFVAEDISKSIADSGGAIVEVNSAPGIRMHLYPSGGKPRNVGKDIIEYLYPPDSDNNLPIVSVTGTNGKTTVVRLIAHVLSCTGLRVGFTSTGGSYINNKCICTGDNSGPNSAKALLADRRIDAAVLETARGGIIRQGLGYDLADIGIITNISEDHLGIDGIDTVKDLAFVKSLVAEAVKKDGYAVLNADDELTDYILQRVKGRTILFHKNSNIKESYKSDEYIRCYTEDDKIYIKDKNQRPEVIPVADIPITRGGTVECNIENSLAAVSGLYGLGIALPDIREGLRSFKDNSGRFNLFDMQGYKIMLDYAHNKSGYEAVLKACISIDSDRYIGIIGMPGDRPDKAVREVTGLCSGFFDFIYLKEDRDLRGRKRGELINLMYNCLIDNGYDKNYIEAVSNEAEALNKAIADARQGDLIVVLYEKLEPLIEIVEREREKMT